jgi:hypothetical protein
MSGAIISVHVGEVMPRKCPYTVVQDGTAIGEICKKKNLKNYRDLPMYDVWANHTQIYYKEKIIYDSKRKQRWNKEYR